MIFRPKNLTAGHNCLKIQQEAFSVVPSVAEIFCRVFNNQQINSLGNTQSSSS